MVPKQSSAYTCARGQNRKKKVIPFPKPVLEEEAGAPADDPEKAVHRYVLTAIAANARKGVSLLTTLPDDRQVLLLTQPTPFAAALVKQLCDAGLRVCTIAPGARTCAIDNNRFEADFHSAQSLAPLKALLGDAATKVSAVINLLGLEPADAPTDDELPPARALFLLLQLFEPDLRSTPSWAGACLINISALDGCFGLQHRQLLNAESAGTLGVCKSALREWSGLKLKCIDLDPDSALSLRVSNVWDELASGDTSIEVGFSADGQRIRLQESASPITRLASSLNKDSVILLTGGALGITAELAVGLAQASRVQLILVGRSALPDEENAETTSIEDPAALRLHLIERLKSQSLQATPVEVERRLKRILKDRSIQRNIARMRAAGSTVEYHALDVTDKNAFGGLIDAIYQRYGKIDGVVHGAGVIEDKLIRDKQADSFDRVYRTKVLPARILEQKLRAESLQFILFFSSVAGRFGNMGQSDYAAANEVLNKLAENLRVRWPEVQSVAIGWGPWDSGMVSPALKELYAERGVHLIPVPEGVNRCLAELALGPAGAAQVVITASMEQIAHRGLGRK